LREGARHMEGPFESGFKHPLIRGHTGLCYAPQEPVMCLGRACCDLGVVELSDRGDDGALLRFGEFGIDGKGKYLAAGGFGYGKVAGLVAEIGEGFLEVQGNRIVDFRGNAAGAEVFAKVVAITGADRELIVDVSELRRGDGQFQF
jgi:hypothetical protein